MKLIIKVNPETGEVEGLWDGPGKPPPLIWPKVGSKGPKKKKKERDIER
jgi:hypothetical protein